MNQSHRQKIESFLGNQRDQLQEEYDEDKSDLDGIELSDQFKQDSQYKTLIGNLESKQPLSSKKKLSRSLDEDPKYKGKKVTRKEIEEIDQEDLMISDSSFEDEENEDTESEEESVKSGDNNGNQISLVSKKENEQRKKIKNKKLEESEDENNEDQNDADDDDIDEEFKQLKKITKKVVEQKKNKQYFQDKMKIDDIINEIDQEDQNINPESKKEQENEFQKAKGVRQQIELWKELVFIRFTMHKNLELAKKFPNPQDLGGFDSKELTKKKKYLELNILRNIDLLQNIRGNLTEKSNGPKDNILKKKQVKVLQKFIHHNNITKEQYENQIALNIQNLWKENEESFDEIQSWVEENILKWSQKTQLLNSINLKRSGMGALVQTPIGQAQKAMQQLENLIYKSQLKRSTFRILGKDVSNVQKETDPEIYDDSDLYHELLKEYMTEIEENKEIGEDGLLFDSTRLYLLERKLKQQEKKQKLVDRRASKSRKIRYDTHQKLVNFMNPIDNKELLEGRNEIIKCLFGKFEKTNNDDEDNEKKGCKDGQQLSKQTIQEEPKKQVKMVSPKKSKKKQNAVLNEDDIVDLI